MRFRFTIRDLLWIVIIAALAVGWFLERRKLTSRIELFELQLAQAKNDREDARNSQTIRVAEPQSKFQTAQDFVAFLRQEPDWYKFDRETGPFIKTPAAADAVALLLPLVEDSNTETRTHAVYSLGRIKRDPELVVPVLIGALSDADANVRWNAANALGEFGDQSKAAIPILTQEMNNDDSVIATFSALTLKKIDPTIDIGPRLLQLLKSPQRENRWRAVVDLSPHVESTLAESALVAMFEKETDTEIRGLIARALNQPPQ